MKKICYVVTVPFTIKAFFIPQLRYLADNGFDVTVVCCDDGLIAEDLGEKIRFHGVDIPRGLSLFGSIKAILNLKSFFKKEKFDLIQYSTPNAAFYSAIAAKICGCKIRNYHLMGYRYLGASGISRCILKSFEKAACALSTSIECVSNSNLELGVNDGIFKREKATVVWNGSTGGVDVSRFDYGKRSQWRSELRGKFGYNEEDFVFGFVGRITRDKGINELIQAFFELNDNSKLFIIGSNEHDGTVDSALWKKAEESPNILIHAPTSEIEKVFAMIDVLVLPSYREGFGNVIIEAGAMGTPSIVSDIPGPIDCVIPSETAITFDSKNVVSLLKAMKTISAFDYKHMGIIAREFAKESFDTEKLNRYICERKQSLVK